MITIVWPRMTDTERALIWSPLATTSPSHGPTLPLSRESTRLGNATVVLTGHVDLMYSPSIVLGCQDMNRAIRSDEFTGCSGG